MSYRYQAEACPLTPSDEVPFGAIIIARGIIRVINPDDSLQNTYLALVYEYDGKKFAVYLDKALKTFRSVEIST